MVYCYVPHCYSGSFNSTCDKQTRDEENHIAFFSPPKDEEIFKKWKVKIGRVDREGHRDKVCSVHFHEDDIQRTSEKIIGGKNLKRPKRRHPLGSSTQQQAINFTFYSRLNSLFFTLIHFYILESFAFACFFVLTSSNNFNFLSFAKHLNRVQFL